MAGWKNRVWHESNGVVLNYITQKKKMTSTTITEHVWQSNSECENRRWLCVSIVATTVWATSYVATWLLAHEIEIALISSSGWTGSLKDRLRLQYFSDHNVFIVGAKKEKRLSLLISNFFDKSNMQAIDRRWRKRIATACDQAER